MLFRQVLADEEERGMDYLSVSEVASIWGLSERSVRNYCARGRVPGAFLTGKTWNIPADAGKPARSNAGKASRNDLLGALREQQRNRQSGGIYHKVQVDLTYNSNRIEGSKLTADQTRYIFETSTIGAGGEALPVDDIVEAVNHFRAVDYIIGKAESPLAAGLVKELHRILKTSTTDADRPWFAVGDWKRLPNEVGGRATTPPEDVGESIAELLDGYNTQASHALEDIVAFHVAFERIHPFQDGNGRVGRLIMFKECLANSIVPFIIEDDMKLHYYRGLSEWDEERGFLMGTCLAAQDRFKAALDYFRIGY